MSVQMRVERHVKLHEKITVVTELRCVACVAVCRENAIEACGSEIRSGTCAGMCGGLCGDVNGGVRGGVREGTRGRERYAWTACAVACGGVLRSCGGIRGAMPGDV